MPEPAVIPLLPRHVHALTASRGPIVLNSATYDGYLSSNGNVAPELFKCVAPLKVGGKLVGLAALGRREGDTPYDEEELSSLDLLGHYVAISCPQSCVDANSGATCCGEGKTARFSAWFLRQRAGKSLLRPSTSSMSTFTAILCASAATPRGYRRGDG